MLIAKLDRLARDVHSLLGLEKAGADFIAADMPHANRLTVGIMALVAEEEARTTSGRTKAALAGTKARRRAIGKFKARVKRRSYRGWCTGGLVSAGGTASGESCALSRRRTARRRDFPAAAR
ncbi:recombinase family protein [Muricoccus aerilatus]|uniref:recombinase family protein n=1 Tax=Muricoccus aerilatus TaxID=452982 RepID=UPI001FDF314D|nr:recombinase family protein [Roseomonas aerilata]